MVLFINKGVAKLNNRLLNSELHISLVGKILVMVCALVVYACCFIFFSHRLMVSINYFVLIPMFVSASLFGFWGGVISGILGLPANLLMLHLSGDILYAPPSKITGLVFGIIIGTILGYSSSFFSRLRLEILEHKKAKKMLDNALNQKQLLLRETHHRIKNNLAIIMGIIELEIMEGKDQRQEVFLRNLINRIRSVSITQNLLYSIENINQITMHPFLSKLIDQIKLALPKSLQDIQFNLVVNQVVLDIDLALPIGLIINESCTNSIKYAFNNIEKPYINIILRPEEDGGYFLKISDNGSGLPENILECGSDSIGLNLIKKLAGQMHADYSFKNENGAVLEIRLKKTQTETKLSLL